MSTEIVAQYQDSNGQEQTRIMCTDHSSATGLAGLHFLAREEDGGFRLVEGTGEFEEAALFGYAD